MKKYAKHIPTGKIGKVVFEGNSNADGNMMITYWDIPAVPTIERKEAEFVILVIAIDFIKNRSLGNVYGANDVNNVKIFEAAEKAYRSNKPKIDESVFEVIIKNVTNSPVGSDITVPINYLPNNQGFHTLKFHVQRIEGDTVYLNLLEAVVIEN